MYSKKYRLEKIEEFNHHNPIYDRVEGCVCYPVYFNIGERGWFLYDSGYTYDPPHRVHTSVVKEVLYGYDNIVLTTQNTRFVFKEKQT